MLGLEVHVELGTASKMFCGCSTEFGAEPNTQVCPVCLGLPGSMPVVNATAIEYAIRIGLALNCSIAAWCRFARKNYFYPDMPKNFQISQYDEPIAYDGWCEVEVATGGETFRIEIERAHMEEDTGKSLHVGGATGRIHGAEYSLLDYNRSGVPLVEIVTKPIEGAGDKAPQVARAYVAQLRDLLRSLGVSDVRMEQGSLRCDANLSLRPAPAAPSSAPGPRPRTSTRCAAWSGRSATRSPGRRRVLAAGGTDQAGDPALPRGHRDHHVRPPQGDRGGLPLLPGAGPGAGGAEPGVGGGDPGHAARAAGCPAEAAQRGLGLHRPGDARPGHRRRGRPDRGDGRGRRVAPERPQVVADRARPAGQRRRASSWPTPAITPAQVAEVQALVEAGTINDKLARQVVDGVLAGEGIPDEVVARAELAVVSDDGALGAAVDDALAANPDVADKIRSGKVQAAGAMIGAVMKAMRGQADAAGCAS